MAVLDGVLDGLQWTSADSVSAAFKCMDAIDSTRAEEPMALQDLAQYSAALLVIRQHCDGNDVWSSLHRARVMLSECHVAAAIVEAADVYCPQLVADHISLTDSLPLDTWHDTFTSDFWLDKLTHRVLFSIKCGTAVSVKSSEFLPNSEGLFTEFFDDPIHVRRRKNISSSERPRYTCQYIARILQCWFKTSSLFQLEARAKFVKCMTECMGTGSLFMRCSWDTYSSLPSWLFGSNCPSRDSCHNPDVRFHDDYIQDFVQFLQADKGIKGIQRSLRKLQAKYIEVQQARAQHIRTTIKESTRRAHMQELESSMVQYFGEGPGTGNGSQQHTQASGSGKGKGKATSGASDPSSGSESGDDSDRAHREPTGGPHAPLPTSPDPSQSETALIVASFLRDANIAWKARTGQLPNDFQPTAAQRVLIDDSDTLLPLREKGASRCLVNNNMDQAAARTPSGLFSLLMFRQVLFNTEAFRTCPAHMAKV